MHIGKLYGITEFLYWTRRTTAVLFLLSLIPILLYHFLGWQWVAIPWTVIALLGTATAFIVGFKNTQTYNRTWEARQIWGALLNTSRAWGTQTRDFLENKEATRELVYRHFAWLTALRYQLREPRTWETTSKAYNKEYATRYSIPEREEPFEAELARYLPADELAAVLATKNRAAQLMSRQGVALKNHYAAGILTDYQFVELQRLVRDFFDQQGKSERIKNFPYPRQFASINRYFVWLFALLLPFGMLREFDKLNEGVTGFMQGHMVWLALPFSMLLSWVYTSLEQVGESTENPFEGGANDVPISQISRSIEIDLREMLGETDLPPARTPKNNIVL